MPRKLAYSLTLAAGLWTASVHALGLGEIDVRSKLNQRFTAVIPVVSATSDELTGLTLKLARNEDFNRAGIERSDYLSTLDFAVVGTGANAQIRVSSSQIARDPFLTFIVEATWNGGRLLREYTVLLDPPAGADAPSASVPPVPAKAAPAPAPAVVAPAPTPAVVKAPPPEKAAAKPVPPPAPAIKPAPKPVEAATASAQDGTYGPISATDTLWSIATKLRPSTDVTMDQMLLALYQGNPKAFDGGINGLLKGSRLVVPTAEQIRSTDAATAKAKVAELRGLVKSTAAASEPALKLPPAEKLAVAEPVKPIDAPKPAPAPVVKEKPAPIEKAKPEAAPKQEPVTPPPAAEVAPAPAPAEAHAADVAQPAPAPVETAPATAEAVPADAPAAAAPAAETTPAPEAAAPAAPAPKPAAPSEDVLGEYQTQLIGLVGVLVLGLIALAVVRSRRNNKPAKPARIVPPPVAPILDPIPSMMPDQMQSAAEAMGTEMADQAPAMAETQQNDMAMEPAEPTVEASSFTDSMAAGGGLQDLGLDASDPLTEADFHVAYGLFDEAIQLLKQAIIKDPARTELQLKLAETYFAASKPVEFQELAETLQGQLGDSDWAKLVTMGRQLCPDATLFHEPMQQAQLQPNEAPMEHGLSFADFDMSKPASESVPDEAPLNIVDFDLDKEIGGGDAPIHDMHDALDFPATTMEPTAKDPNVVDLDLSSFDLGSEPAVEMSALQTDKIEFDLEELDLGKHESGDETALALGDEVDTKLDLARAYADMGDNEAARNLLTEVIETGNDAQKKEAESLNQRLASA